MNKIIKTIKNIFIPESEILKDKIECAIDDEIIDWDKSIAEKPFDTCPYIDFEAVEDDFVQ